jgi:hypothetical protein
MTRLRSPRFRSLLAACLLSLAACSSFPPSAMVADGSTFTMAIGESVTFADQGRLRYVRLASDSRCPPRVTCIWAGDAELVFEWHGPAGTAETFSLHTGRGDKSHAMGARTLTLVAVTRAEQGLQPEAQLRVDR